MTTEVATQVAANTPPVIPTAPATGAVPFGAGAMAAAGLIPGANTAPASPVDPAAQAPPITTTAAQDADAALAAARKIASKRETQRRAQADADARARTAETQLQQERAARAAAEERAARLDKDPLAVMREKKITADMLAKAAIEDASPEGRIARLEAELHARDARDAEQRTKSQAAQQQQMVDRGRADYVRTATAIVDEKPAYPYLAAAAEHDPEAIAIQAEGIATRYFNRMRERTGVGKWPTRAQLHEYQEELYSKAVSKTGATTAAAEQSPPVTTTSKPKAVATRSLAARTAVPATVPKSFNEMTPKEMRDAMTAKFRATGKPAQ